MRARASARTVPDHVACLFNSFAGTPPGIDPAARPTVPYSRAGSCPVTSGRRRRNCDSRSRRTAPRWRHAGGDHKGIVRRESGEHLERAPDDSEIPQHGRRWRTATLRGRPLFQTRFGQSDGVRIADQDSTHAGCGRAALRPGDQVGDPRRGPRDEGFDRTVPSVPHPSPEAANPRSLVDYGPTIADALHEPVYQQSTTNGIVSHMQVHAV